jgi:methylmalonyl-CoA mutase
MSEPGPFPAVDEAAWRDRVAAELGDLDFEAILTTELAEGLRVHPLYTAHGEDCRQPRRGGRPDIGWCLTARCEAADPEAVNAQVRADLEGGAGALWLRLDSAVRAGLDADGPGADSLAGRDGLAAYHLDDLDMALDGVPLDGAALLVDAGANALPVAAGVLALAERRGHVCKTLDLHWNCDPLASLARDGRTPGSLDDLKVEMRQLASFCAAALPASTAVAVSDLPYHAAGADADQELGMAAATLVAYLRWMDAEGLAPTESLPLVLLRAAVGRDIFLGIAKLRALRLLWRKIAGACGIAEPPPARVHAVTSDRPLTERDPWGNMLRATTQTFAAVTGGADWVTTAAWDRPLGPSSPAGRRLASNTQSILGEEAALGAVLDPAGGSHYVEQLTDDLARRSWAFLQDIERAGGAAAVLADGWLEERLAWRRQARFAAIRDGRRAITGVNRFPAEDEKIPERHAEDSRTVARRAVERVGVHRRSRDAAPDLELACALDRLAVWVRMAAEGATLGEIALSLRRRTPVTMTPLPAARDEEALNRA